MARKAIEAATSKQAIDIVLLDTHKVCSFADFFIICSGDNERQIKTIHEEIEHTLKKEGIFVNHYEGTPDTGWVLLDYNDVIVHIFSSTERDFYQLEKLWNKASLMVRVP